ncbi:MAG: adenosylcobinamide-GDP ribazoletransferase [Deltaproteobacteria bacterium]|nr:adenosylcobinamide-GDP ribazoletransferase [Deltaproteobacteria bacterium]
MRGLVTALRTLSILPAPGRDADRMAAALPWFPAVGALLGWLLLSAAWGLERIGLWEQGTAFFVLAAGVALTGAIHIDGVADCADGLGGGRDREKRLAIMKDSHVGVFGVTAVILLLLGKWVCLTRLFQTGGHLWLPTAWIVSRTAPVALAFYLPYARDKGTGADFVRGSRWPHLAAALALASLLIALGGGAAHLGAWIPALPMVFLWGYYTRRRLGGVTGDVLGAGVEMTETLILATGCLP